LPKPQACRVFLSRLICHLHTIKWAVSQQSKLLLNQRKPHDTEVATHPSSNDKLRKKKTKQKTMDCNSQPFDRTCHTSLAKNRDIDSWSKSALSSKL